MDHEAQEKQEKQTIATSRSSKRIFLLLFVLLLVIGLSGYSAYYWQHKKVTRLTTNLSDANKQIDYLKAQQVGSSKQIDHLASENNKLTSELSDQKTNNAPTIDTSTETAPTLPKLSITVTGAQKYTPSSNPNEKDIVVNVTITNPSSSTINLPVSSFILYDPVKDSSPDFATHAGETLPDGTVVLNDVTLSPGQTIKGGLLFSVFNANYNNYTMTYDTQSYAVSVN